MTITLSDAQERRITEAILQAQRNEIGTKIDRALAQFERGEFLTGEQSRADMEKRKAAFLSNPSR